MAGTGAGFWANDEINSHFGEGQTYQVNDLQNNFLFPTRFVLDVKDSLERIVDIRIRCKFMSSCTLGFVAGLPSQKCSNGIKVHCSHNTVVEIMAGNVRWEINVPGDFVIDWNPYDNMTICNDNKYLKESQK